VVGREFKIKIKIKIIIIIKIRIRIIIREVLGVLMREVIQREIYIRGVLV
jgi:hypothetical protein